MSDLQATMPHLYPMFSASQADIMWRNTIGTVTTLQPLTTSPGTVANPAFGPELSMGRMLKDANPSHAIMLQKQALGSTSLAEDWNPDFVASPTDPPSAAMNQYDRMIFRYTTTMSYLTTHGYSVNLKGLAWMQGEEDAKYQDMAMSYEANLQRFIASVRTDIAADLPIIIGRINATSQPYRDLVRDAQLAVTDPTSPAYVPGVSIINTDDLPLQDKVHYNAAGQVALGLRFGSAFTQLEQQGQLHPVSVGSMPRAVPEPSSVMLTALLLALLILVGMSKMDHYSKIDK
jgi:hypothetical protein